MNYIKTINAQISDKTITKVTRLFNATLTDILNELLQNARRAGASQIHFTTALEANPPTLTIHDDGVGVDDPQMLLNFGDSGWNGATQTREDPAGMGVFALSGRGAEIASKDWHVTLTPEHFSGTIAATVEQAEQIEGTRLVIPLEAGETKALSKAYIASVVRYYPLPVFLNGEEVTRENFLHDALYVEEWKGLRIGVKKRFGLFTCWKEKSQLNFHGLRVCQELPAVEAYGVGIEVIDCPELKLVLPARKEVVQDKFFALLNQECLRVIYRFIETLEGHSLPYKTWQEAQSLGVDLPEADPVLTRFVAETAQGNHVDWEKVEKVPVQPDSIVVTAFEEDLQVALQNCFWQALNQSQTEQLKTRQLFSSNKAYEGYTWYDRLSRLTALDFRIINNGKSIMVDAQCPQSDAVADQIMLDLTVVEQSGSEKSITLEAPVCIVENENGWWDFDDSPIIVAKDHPFDTDSLAVFLEEACFSFDQSSDDYDSYDTQLENFQEQAMKRAVALLYSEEEAVCHHLKRLIDRYVRWNVPRDKTAVIRVSPLGTVAIELLSPSRP